MLQTSFFQHPNLWRFLPFILAIMFLISLFLSLQINPNTLPSARIHQSVPEFSLQALDGLTETDGKTIPGFSHHALQKGNMSIVNFWASWCEPCRIEMPLLLSLRQQNYPIYGINVKDNPNNAIRFLSQTGNPFLAVGSDPRGLTSIDFGVYGFPETFIINGQGIVVYRHVGLLTPQVISEIFLPLLTNQTSVP